MVEGAAAAREVLLAIALDRPETDGFRIALLADAAKDMTSLERSWTDDQAVMRWNVGEELLPDAAGTPWEAEQRSVDLRHDVLEAIRRQLVRAADRGLLEDVQAAELIQLICLAIDGEGPVSRTAFAG